MTCKSCTGTNANECTACYANVYLLEGTCVTTCPSSRYYPDTTDFKCYRIYRIFPFSEVLMMVLFLACFEGCATCTGPTPNDCTSCDSGLYLTNNTCVDECPSGTFPDDTSQSCEGCSSFLLK